jgi:hypothetical protein
MKQLVIHQGSKEEIIQVQEGVNLLDVLTVTWIHHNCQLWG